MKSMELVKLCKIDGPDVVDKVAALVAKFRLIEWEKPSSEKVADDIGGVQQLTLGQMLYWLREKYDAGLKLFIKPEDIGTDGHSVWFLLNVDGFLWYGDATEMIKNMSNAVPQE